MRKKVFNFDDEKLELAMFGEHEGQNILANTIPIVKHIVATSCRETEEILLQGIR